MDCWTVGEGALCLSVRRARASLPGRASQHATWCNFSLLSFAKISKRGSPSFSFFSLLFSFPPLFLTPALALHGNLPFVHFGFIRLPVSSFSSVSTYASSTWKKRAHPTHSLCFSVSVSVSVSVSQTLSHPASDHVSPGSPHLASTRTSSFLLLYCPPSNFN